jgi:hypothetical protein
MAKTKKRAGRKHPLPRPRKTISSTTNSSGQVRSKRANADILDESQLGAFDRAADDEADEILRAGGMGRIRSERDKY